MAMLPLNSGTGRAFSGSTWCRCPGYRSVQLVGVFRLRHRPHTRVTAAWLAGLKEGAEQYRLKYLGLAEKARASTLRHAAS